MRILPKGANIRGVLGLRVQTHTTCSTIVPQLFHNCNRAKFISVDVIQNAVRSSSWLLAVRKGRGIKSVFVRSSKQRMAMPPMENYIQIKDIHPPRSTDDPSVYEPEMILPTESNGEQKHMWKWDRHMLNHVRKADPPPEFGSDPLIRSTVTSHKEAAPEVAAIVLKSVGPDVLGENYYLITAYAVRILGATVEAWKPCK